MNSPMVDARYRGWDLTYGFGLMPLLGSLLKDPDPVVVDGGAYKGKFTLAILGMRPQARIHAFEPIPRRVRKLKKQFSGYSNVVVHAEALGQERGESELHVAGSNPFSSLLFPSRNGISIHGDKVRPAEKETVSVGRLDGIPSLNRSDIDLLKLDVQGYELQVLKGAGKLLERTGMVLVEVCFETMYERQALFPELSDYMKGAGFLLKDVYRLRVRSRPGSAPRHLSGDAVFLNSRRF